MSVADRRAARQALALPAALALAALAGGGAVFWTASIPHVSGPLPCATGLLDSPLDGAAREPRPGADGLLVLSASLTRENGRLRVVRGRPDWRALRAPGRSVGIALRARPGPETRAEALETTATLAGLARALAAESRAWGVDSAEIVLDLADPEHDLDAWRPRLLALQKAAAPRPVRIAAPPSWIGRGDFLRLAAAAGSWVLKLPAPGGDSRLEPGSVRVLAERAARLRLPFRVAIPGPPDAALVRAWTDSRPETLAGVVVY